jgi:AcrR family transcriptional regulator
MENTRQQEILTETIRLVSSEGMQNLTIRNVATAVGVSEPAIYRYFKSKHELLVAVLEHLQKAMYPHFALLLESQGSDIAFFKTFLTGLFQELEKTPAYALFVFSEEAFHVDAELRPLMDRMLEENLKLLGRAIALLQDRGGCRTDLDTSQLAAVMMGTIRLTITRWHLGKGSFSLSSQIDPLYDTLETLFSIKQ